MGTHKDLDVWKLSIDFVVEIYKITHRLPDEEKYGLCSQMQRAAVSIPSNIAEGSAKSGSKEYLHYLHIALASAAELETYLMIIERLNYIETSGEQQTLGTIRSKLINLIRYLKKQPPKTN